MPVLARRGFRAIAPDLPGFGLSEPPGDVSYFDPPLPFYPQFVRELAEQIASRPVVLVGHSLGATIAAVTAVCFSDLVERLVLVSPGGVGDQLGPLLRVCSVPLAARALRRAPAALFRRAMSRAFFNGGRIPRSLQRRWWRHFSGGPGAEMSRVLAQLATFRGPRQELRRYWARRLREIRCPTLVIWGRDDRTTPLTGSEVLAALPEAETYALELTRHFPLLEHRDEFIGVLVKSLRAARSPTPQGRRRAPALGGVASMDEEHDGGVILPRVIGAELRRGGRLRGAASHNAR